MLSLLADLEKDLKRNYKSSNLNHRALASIAALQCELFTTYTVFLGGEYEEGIITKSVILRTILENQGSIMHIKNNISRAKNYLDYVYKMRLRIKNNVENKKTLKKDSKWSESEISQRVSLINDNATRLYDMLSNFTHGNNVLDLLNDKKLYDGYVNAIDSYFIGLFMGLLAELAVGLELKDEKRKQIFDVINEVS